MLNASTTLNVIVDTSYLVGLVDSLDVWHAQSRAIHAALEQRSARLVYTDCVLSETVSVLARRSEERGRSEQFTNLIDQLQAYVPPSSITWIFGHVRRWYEPILARVRQSQGTLNFHDALLVLAALEMGVSVIVSFDRDFDDVPELVRVHLPESLPDDPK